LAAKIGKVEASKFAKACLLELLHRFKSLSSQHVRCIILYAPSTSRKVFSQLLAQHKLQDKWELMEMTTATKSAPEEKKKNNNNNEVSEELKSPDLGSKLKHCLTTLQSQGCGSVLFIGNDCVELSLGTIREALKCCNQERKAVICPATDGGYVLLGLPSHCPTSVFDNVQWSHLSTCVSQIKAITDNGNGVRISVLSTYADVDDVNDLQRLKTTLEKNPNPSRAYPYIKVSREVLYNKHIELPNFKMKRTLTTPGLGYFDTITTVLCKKAP